MIYKESDDEDFDDVIGVEYEITCSTKKSFKPSNTKTKVIKDKKKYTLSNLPKKENYIKLRGYILNKDGEKIYSDYSKTIKVIIK